MIISRAYYYIYRRNVYITLFYYINIILNSYPKDLVDSDKSTYNIILNLY